MNPNSKVFQMPKPQGMRAFMLYIDDWRSSWKVQAMDDHEKQAYLNLLMKAASEPDCGLPDNDYELAVISGMGKKWFRPTHDKEKRLPLLNEDGSQAMSICRVRRRDNTSICSSKTGSDSAEVLKNQHDDFKTSQIRTLEKPVFKSCGMKIRECFTYRPISEQTNNRRIYNERLYKEYLHKKEVSRIKSDNGRRRNRPPEDEHMLFFAAENGSENPANAEQTPPQPPTFNSSIDVLGEPPPPTTTGDLENIAAVVGGGGSTQTQETKPQTPDNGYNVFVAHCTTSGLSPGSQGLWRRLRLKFPNLSPLEVCKHLPCFSGQESAGLWDHHTDTVLTAEAERRANPPPARKPSKPQGKEPFSERIKRL
jgi:hypothetical protein